MRKFFLAFMVFQMSLAYSKDGELECLGAGDQELNFDIEQSFQVLEGYKRAHPSESFKSILQSPLARFPGLKIVSLFPNAVLQQITVKQALKSSINMLSSANYRRIKYFHLRAFSTSDTQSSRDAYLAQANACHERNNLYLEEQCGTLTLSMQYQLEKAKNECYRTNSNDDIDMTPFYFIMMFQ